MIEAAHPPSLPPVDGSQPRPKVSVVLTTFRRPSHIGGTIRSVLAQTFTDYELLIRDDGSGDDGTAEAVAAAAQGDPRVRYHRNSSSLRMPNNLNEGIRASRGHLVAVCHDHDLLHSRYLERSLALLDQYPSALFAHHGIEVIDQNGQHVANHVGSWGPLTRGTHWLKVMLARFSCPVCALCVVRRDAHERYGLYNPDYGFVSDVEMWMRLSLAGDVAYAAEPLVRVREREADHFASVNPWPVMAKIFAIHRRYVRLAYTGVEGVLRGISLEFGVEAAVFRNLLSGCWRSKSIAELGRLGPLRSHGGPISRLVAKMLPCGGSN